MVVDLIVAAVLLALGPSGNDKLVRPSTEPRSMNRSTTTTPATLVYSCSGCSSAAQLASHLAVRLDRNGDAEMSCIAGLGGQVKSLIRTAKTAAASGRPILAIDGCPLACVKNSLAQHGIAPSHHVQLGTLGIRKLQHADFDIEVARRLLDDLTQQVRAMNGAAHLNPPAPRR